MFSPGRFSLPANLLETSTTRWLAGREARTETRSEDRSGTSLWLAPGARVPPTPHTEAHIDQLESTSSSLAGKLREGLLGAGAGFGREKSVDDARAETDLTEKLRRSLQTFSEKSAADWMTEEEDDEDSIMTLNTDTTNTEDFDDFSDLQADLDTWLAK